MPQLLSYELSRAILDCGLAMKTGSSWFGDPDHFPEPGVRHIFTKLTEAVNSQDEDHRELCSDDFAYPIPAPDTLEMMNVLRHCAFMAIGGGVRIFDNSRGWHICFDYLTGGLGAQNVTISEVHDSPVEAMGRILIELLSKQIINPERLIAYLSDKGSLLEVIQP